MTKAKDHREYLHGNSPTFLRGRYGERFVGVLGLMLDAISETTQQAATASYRVAQPPAGAETRIGRERMLPPWPGEAVGHYLSRLRRAWTIWRYAGLSGGLSAIFSSLDAGFVAVTRSPHVWNWDGLSSSNWSRFWLVLTSHPFTSTRTWGDGSRYGDFGVIGLDATPDQIQWIRSTVRQFSPAHAPCDGIVVVIDPGTWTDAPTGNWDYWVNRSPAARYISP